MMRRMWLIEAHAHAPRERSHFAADAPACQYLSCAFPVPCTVTMKIPPEMGWDQQPRLRRHRAEAQRGAVRAGGYRAANGLVDVPGERRDAVAQRRRGGPAAQGSHAARARAACALSKQCNFCEAAPARMGVRKLAYTAWGSCGRPWPARPCDDSADDPSWHRHRQP